MKELKGLLSKAEDECEVEVEAEAEKNSQKLQWSEITSSGCKACDKKRRSLRKITAPEVGRRYGNSRKNTTST